MAKNIRIFRDVNTIFIKRRRVKRTYLQKGGALNQKKSKILLKVEKKGKRPAPVNIKNTNPSKWSKIIFRRYGVCDKTKYNTRTYSNDRELSRESQSD